jgi:hypothetical protein
VSAAEKIHITLLYFTKQTQRIEQKQNRMNNQMNRRTENEAERTESRTNTDNKYKTIGQRRAGQIP